jgi:hypothetical protein
MARTKSGSIEQAIQEAVDGVVSRVLARIERQVNRVVDARISAEVKKAQAEGRGRRRTHERPRARREITTWIADRRARRVPKFVIGMTNGLDTKKKIVAKFGEDARFEKGKPLPPAHAKPHEAGASEARAVKAKPPTVRKAAAS